MSENRCPYCGQNYAPYARAVERQKHCGQAACRRKHERARDRAWRNNDVQWRQARQVKVASGRRIGATRSSGAPSAAASSPRSAAARRSERNKRKERTAYRDTARLGLACPHGKHLS